MMHPQGRTNGWFLLFNAIGSVLSWLLPERPLAPVVDETGRRQCAQLLRQLASGRVTNDEFEDSCMEIDTGLARLGLRDDAILNIWRFAWLHYDDTREHRLTGRDRLSRLQRRLFAQAYLFLRHGVEYRPVPDPYDRRDAREDGRCWPFASTRDFVAARARPRLLAGAARASG